MWLLGLRWGLVRRKFPSPARLETNFRRKLRKKWLRRLSRGFRFTEPVGAADPRTITGDTMYNQKYAFTWIQPGGWTLFAKSIRRSNGSSQSQLQGYHGQLEKHLPELEEGSLVLDTRPCEGRKDWIHNVLSGPLVNPDLAPGEVDSLTDTEDCIFHEVGGFAGMLAIHENLHRQGKLGSLDKVSPEMLCAWWKERGAKVGYIKEGEMIFPEE